MHAERNVLIGEVFPRLREAAETELGVRIQEIDLRWGVTENQVKRGEVVDLCLEGIEECQPYFFCMLGKRYGWTPAPVTVKRKEFEAILGNPNIAIEDRDLLQRSYNLATADARVYQLDIDISNNDKERIQGVLDTAGIREAGMSITEQEIELVLSDSALPRYISDLDTLLSNPTNEITINDSDKALLSLFYIRQGAERIWRLQPGADESEHRRLLDLVGRLGCRRKYHSFFLFRKDVGEDHPDYIETEEIPRNRLKKLKNRIIKSKKPIAVKDYPCSWHPEEIKNNRLPIRDVEEFREMAFNLLWDHLKQNPELQEDKTVEKSDLEIERDFHLRFIDSRTYNFQGRTELLKEIEQKIDHALQGSLEVNGIRAQAIMVVGEPGSGKSALLAKLYQNVTGSNGAEPNKLVIPHFVGASPRSTNPRYILTDWCRVLSNEFGMAEEIPTDQIKLKETFSKFLRKTDRPILIILDAINQLQSEENARKMQWLPDKLPDHVCIVTSLVEDTRKKAAT